MARKKFTQLPAAGALTGAEIVAIVQGGESVQSTAQDIADLGGGGGGGTWGSITGTLSNQTDLLAALNLKLDSLITFNPQGASYTLLAADLTSINAGDNLMIEMNVGSANDLTVPLNATLAFPIGTQILIKQLGAGLTTVVATGSVSITGSSGSLASPGQNALMALIKKGTNTWYLENGVPAASVAASAVSFTPAGNIAATDVQDAIEELDTEKASITYVDNLVAGLKWKAPVRVATTVNGTLATAYENGDTVDGVVLATGNRILLKNQTTQTENGIYTVNASGAPTRATDADSAAELEGAAVTVQEGTSNENTTWLQTTDSITLGSSNIVFAQFGSSVPDSSETVKGIIEIATQAEVTTGTDDVRAITPLKYATAVASKANLASPTFTGTPAAPTPAEGNNSTLIATTEFVTRANVGGDLYLYSTSF